MIHSYLLSTIEVDMKYAFLQNNILRLPQEHKAILAANLATAIFCFLPWYSESPSYDIPDWTNAFGGNSFLIGWVIFLLSITVLVYFHDILWERKKIKLPFEIHWLFLGISIQQLVLIILAWSVLYSFGSIDYEAGPTFSILLAFFAQFASAVSAFLLIKGHKKNVVKDFFDLPKPTSRGKKKEADAENTLL